MMSRGCYAPLALLFLLSSVCLPCPPALAGESPCEPQAPQLLFSIPAKNQTDVPTNTRVVLLVSWATTVTATLNGTTLEALEAADLDAAAYDPGGLEPNETHELVVELGEGPTVKTVKVKFTTGAGPKDAPDAPSLELAAAPDALQDGLCGLVPGAQHCAGELEERRTLKLERAATAWLVEEPGGRAWLWPGSCLPETFVEAGSKAPDTGTCFEVQALGPGGAESLPTTVCPYEDPNAPPADTGSSGGSGSSASTSCTQRSAPSGPSALLLLLMGLGLLGWGRNA